VPGLILQAVALAVALAYYFTEPVRQLLEQLSVFRAETGFVYSFIATGLFGGVLPCLYLGLQPATRKRYDLKQNAALCLFWAYKGVEVDLWYRWQVQLVGGDHSPRTVVLKMLLDQFVYCPLFAVPVTVLVYAWIETHFDATAVAADFRRPNWYLRRALPNLISNLGVWVPAVCIIYALPATLQIPLFNLVLCFFTLLLAHLSRHTAPTKPVG
jgi:hypothetical protein